MKLEGVEQLNAALEELKSIGRAPSFSTRRRALEEGAKVIKYATAAAAPSRSAQWANKGRTFGLSKKAKRFDAIFQSGKTYNAYSSGKGVTLRRAGKEAKSLKDSFRYTATTGTNKHNVNVSVYSTKPTAHLVELGHRTKQGTGKAKGYKPKPGGKSAVAARPFMTSAMRSNAQRAVDAISQALGASVERILKRARKRSQ